MIIEGLRDEASQVAMDIGTEKLVKETRFQKLAEAKHEKFTALVASEMVGCHGSPRKA